MTWLKQSTAVTVKLGPFVDATDGVTLEVGLATNMDNATTGIRVSKNGGDYGDRNSATAPAYDETGEYDIHLDATDTNTLGRLRIIFEEAATTLPVWRDFMVLPANVYDSLVGGSDTLNADVTQWLGTAVTASGGVPDVNVQSMDNDTVTAAAIATAAIDADSIATGAISSAKLSATTYTSIRSVANGTADSGSTTTLVDSAQGSKANDFFNGSYLYITSGTLAGQVRQITDFATSSGTFTVDQAFTSAVGTNTYEVLAGGVLEAGGIGVDAITAGKIQNAAIDAATFGAGAITSSVLASGCIGATQLAADAITAAKIADGAIDAATFAAGAIDSSALAQSAVDEIRSLVSGTADSGSTTTLVDAARTEADTDYWKGAWLLITSGSIANQVREITAFTPGTDTITVSPAFTQAVSTNTYQILPGVAEGGTTPPTSAQIADAVWDEAAAGHTTAGTFGLRLGTGFTDAGVLASNSITASVIATGAIDSDALSNSAIVAIRSVASGTADSGTTTTLVDAARTEADTDYWKGAWLVITSGNINGQVRKITAFTPASDTITVDRAFTQAVGTNNYEIWPSDVLTAGGIDTDAITATKIAADAIGSSELATTAVDEIVDAVWDELSSGHSTAGTYGLKLGTGFTDAGVLASNAVTAAVIANGAIDAATFAANAVDASALATDAVNEIRDAVWANTNSELSTVIGATPTMEDIMQWLLMCTRNQVTTTASLHTVSNDAGTVIAKATLSDVSSTFTRAEFVAGP